MGQLVIFKNSFVTALRSDISRNLPLYQLDGQSWAGELGNRSTRDLPTNVELESPLDLLLPEKKDLKDLENSIRVHKSLRGLTRLQARDPRLWTRLTHVELWLYMRRRWPVEQYKDEPDKARRYVETRYFVPQSEGRALLRNGVARLWWTAYLSHDPDRANPYELTAVLLSTLDITQQILERGLGRAPAVLHGFLEFLLSRKEMLLTGGDPNRARIRALAKFLNLHGGVSLLDCMSKTELMNLLSQELGRILAAEPVGTAVGKK